MSGPILKGSQAEQAANEAEQLERRQKLERLRWWELEESARRCIAISEHLWDGRLAAAIAAQRMMAETLRDRTSTGTRADGVTKYEIDRGVPVPLFTPRDRLQFLKEFTVTLLISARQAGLPVTVEGTKREAQPDEKTEADEAGSGVDETQSADEEVRALVALVEATNAQDEIKGAREVPVSEAPAP